MNQPFTGGCVCGAVRYQCTAQPRQIQMFRCHCRDCQRVTGGAYAPVLYVPASTFQLTKGRIKHHFTPSEAMGKHKRGFCSACGSRLTGGEGKGSTGIGLTASSLDDPRRFKPTVDMWMSDAQPWDHRNFPTRKYPKYPPTG